MMPFTFVVAVLMVGTVNGVVLLEWFNGSGPSSKHSLPASGRKPYATLS